MTNNRRVRRIETIKNIFAIIGFFWTIFMIWGVIPKVSISYYPEYNIEYFGIENTGTRFTLTMVEYRYEITCQNVTTNFTPIEKKIPNLAPKITYPVEFNNLTASILKNALVFNRDRCNENTTMIEIFLDKREHLKTPATNYTIDLYFCDKCTLGVYVKSKETSNYYNYSFYNPMKAQVLIECTDPFVAGGDILGKGCTFSFKPAEDNIYIPPRAFHIAQSEDYNYLIVLINQSII